MIFQLFSECAKQTPGAPALITQTETLTYGELGKEIERVAAALYASGVRPRDRVIVHAERTPRLIATLLALFKLGAIYVPVAKILPKERLHDIKIQSGAHLVIDDSFLEKVGEGGDSPTAEANPDEIAYILFTSGSTGKAKGVCMSLDNFLYFRSWSLAYFSERELRNVLASTSISFDLSIFEILVPLTSGFSITLVNTILDLDDPFSWRPTLINTVPSACQEMLRLKALPSSTITVNLAGEPLRQSIVDQLYAYDHIEAVYNLYGPTECTTYATVQRAKRGDPRLFVSIGKGLKGLKTLIVDDNFKRVNSGERGQLLLSGRGVALGYFKNAEMTQERFIEYGGERVYQTGDIVYENGEGDLEYVGRNDHQVKIRGFRIELGDVESNLLGLDGIEEACVITSDDKSELIGFVIGQGTPKEVQKKLASKVPEYMVPAKLIFIEKMPLNSNGKTDRKALKEISFASLEKREEKRQDAPDEIVKKHLQQLLGITDQIDASQSFFEIGGHSLLATQLLARLRKDFDAKLSLRDIFQSDSIAQIIEKVAPKQASFPMHPAQKKYFLFEEMHPGTGVYNLPLILDIEGVLDQSRLEEAFRAVLNKYPHLSGVYNGSHFVVREIPRPFLQTFAHTSDEEIHAFALAPFSLEGGLAVRAGLFSASEISHTVVFVCHHALIDGLSLSLLSSDLFQFYQRSGDTTPRAPMEWKSDRKDVDFWKNALQGVSIEKNLRWPLFTPRPARFSYLGQTHHIRLEETQTTELKRWSQRHEVSLSTTLLALYFILIHKITDEEELIVGVPFANRVYEEEFAQVGCFVNTLPVYQRVEESQSLADFIRNLSDRFLDFLEHQRVLLEDLLKEMDVERTLSYHPLFQTVFVLNDDFSKSVQIPELSVKEKSLQYPYAKFDLTLNATPREGGIDLAFEGCATLFSQNQMRGFATLYRSLVSSLLEREDVAISQLTYPNPYFVNAKTSFPKSETLISWWERQVAQTPTAVAVHYDSEKLSYKSLNERACALAHRIAAECRTPLVGLIAERNCDLMIGILAILKAGKGYVPIDPGAPKERVEYIIKDSNLETMVLSPSYEEEFKPFVKKHVVIDHQEKCSPLAVNLTPDDPAYVIYTSGSTGEPKGVVVTHHNVVRLFKATESLFSFSSSDVWTLFHSYAFDFSVWEMWGALLYGGKVILINQELRQSPKQFFQLLRKERVTFLNLTPSAFSSLLSFWDCDLEALRTVVFGGEALEPSLVKRWHSLGKNKKTQLVNMYGITETTVHVTFHPVNIEDEVSVIGIPLCDLSLCLVDRQGHTLPQGLEGEILVGGGGVTEGYLGKEELTKRRFPIIDNERIYRTGDKGLFRDDGMLVYRGRLDRQIQLRGYRVELGEIEAVIQKLTRCESLALVEKAGDIEYLIAYIKATNISIAHVKKELKAHLPAYMQPNHIYSIADFPLTINGKVDFQKLLEMRKANDEVSVPKESASPFEVAVATIWKEVLSVDTVAHDVNFFEAGGHSLALIEVCNKLKAQGFDLEITDLFEHATVEALAQFLNSKQLQPV